MVKKEKKEKEEEEEEKKIDIFKHELVPKHILLNADEVKSVLADYHLKPYQLPRIKQSDPAALALKATPGDIIKIIRKSETAGETDYYRYVVEEA